MIVTSSRASVIRYKYAIDAYLAVHPEYDKSKISPNLQFKVPGEPLVAFSDKVKGENCIMTEDDEFISEFDYLKENPFAHIRRDYDYTEAGMNNLGYQSVEKAFDTPDRRLLIVANKFQTGFNQPKLCAMYIDKRIANDIEIVQTYSRLNRTFPGKDTVYIIDFVNDPDIVLNAFLKYDKGAEMEHAQSLEIIYDIKQELDEAEIYTQDDCETYKIVRYKSIASLDEAKKDSYRQKIYKTVAEPAERWKSLLKANQTAYTTWRGVYDKAAETGDERIKKQAQARLDDINEEINRLLNFRKKLKRYCSAYDYITQIVDLGEPDLEVFYGFAKLLSHRIEGTALDEIDISSLVLSDYRINELDFVNPGGDSEGQKLKPMRAGGNGKASKKESLVEIIRRINEVWGSDVSAVTGARTINAIADYVAADEVSRIQIRNSTNSKEAIIADGRLESIIKLAAVALKNNDFEVLAEKIISDPQAWKPLADVIFDMVDKNKRIDMPELMEFIKEEEQNKNGAQ